MKMLNKKNISSLLLISMLMTIFLVPVNSLELESVSLDQHEDIHTVTDSDIIIIEDKVETEKNIVKEKVPIYEENVSTENTLDKMEEEKEDSGKNKANDLLIDEGEEEINLILEDELLKQKILDYLEGKKGEFSFYIIDPVTGEETMINNRSISSASIIKIFLIVEVHKQIRDGKISFSDKLTLKENLKVYGSGILRKKDAGSRYSVEYLLHLVITISDNVAANMLADYVGLKNINSTAKELGMEDTNFGHLILEKEKMTYYYGRNTTNAKDLATMMYKIYSFDCLGEEYDKKMIALFKTCKTNSKIPKRLPKTLEIAHKTGSLPLYEHDAGIVYNEARDFIFASMSNELKSNQDGQLIISTIAKMTYEHMIEKDNIYKQKNLESNKHNPNFYQAMNRIYEK